MEAISRMSELDPIQQSAQAQFDRRSRHYGTQHILADVTDVAEAIEPLQLSLPSDVLDVATGAGHTGLYLAELGHRVTLADITPKMLDEATALARSRGVRVTTREHAAEEMPYPSGVFDLVTCRVSAHHFSRPEAFLTETARVLRPGGFLVLIDGTVEDGRPDGEAWLHEVEKSRDPSHKRFLTPSTWQGLCEAAGLSVRGVVVKPFKQPDLEWYLEIAGTSAEGRRRVWELVEGIPEPAREYFRAGWENGKFVWWWARLTLTASKGGRD